MPCVLSAYVKKHFETEFLLKDKVALPSQQATPPCSHPFIWKRASEWSFLSALLLFQGVYPAVRWTEHSQLPLLLSFLFTATMKKHNRYSPPGHQNRFSINKRSPNVSDCCRVCIHKLLTNNKDWESNKTSLSSRRLSVIKIKWLSPLGYRQQHVICLSSRSVLFNSR